MRHFRLLVILAEVLEVKVPKTVNGVRWSVVLHIDTKRLQDFLLKSRRHLRHPVGVGPDRPTEQQQKNDKSFHRLIRSSLGELSPGIRTSTIGLTALRARVVAAGKILFAR